jgi:hypothetical protein
MSSAAPKSAPRTTVLEVLRYAERLLLDGAYGVSKPGHAIAPRAWTASGMACDPRHERACQWTLEGALIAGAGDRADLELGAFKAAYEVLPTRQYLDTWASKQSASACRWLLHRAMAHVLFPPAPVVPAAPDAPPTPPPSRETP